MNGTKRQPPGITPPSAPAVASTVTSVGARSFVIDAPTLPAPNMPSENPCCSFGYQTETQAMPDENDVPAMPTKNASTTSCAYVSA